MHAFTIILNRQNEFSKQAEKNDKKIFKDAILYWL